MNGYNKSIKHTEWKIKEVLGWAIDRLRDNCTEAPDAEARYLLSAILGCTRSDLFLRSDWTLSTQEMGAFTSAIKRRLTDEPLQYIVGNQSFRGLDFKVTRDVLIPRPETELLVEEAVGEINRQKASYKGDKQSEAQMKVVLDLCTGSGCIAVSIAKELTFTKLYAVDIAAKALNVAKENALSHGVIERIEFLQGDLFSPLASLYIEEKMDIIVSNPPYIAKDIMASLPKEVRLFEPTEALDGGKDGLYFLKKIVMDAPKYLKKDGALIMEIGYGQSDEIHDIFTSSGSFGDVSIKEDYSGIKRIAKARKV